MNRWNMAAAEWLQPCSIVQTLCARRCLALAQLLGADRSVTANQHHERDAHQNAGQGRERRPPWLRDERRDAYREEGDESDWKPWLAAIPWCVDGCCRSCARRTPALPLRFEQMRGARGGRGRAVIRRLRGRRCRRMRCHVGRSGEAAGSSVACADRLPRAPRDQRPCAVEGPRRWTEGTSVSMSARHQAGVRRGRRVHCVTRIRPAAEARSGSRAADLREMEACAWSCRTLRARAVHGRPSAAPHCCRPA